MKIKKIVSLILCALALTACADIPPVKEPVPAEQQKIVAPPRDGWTAEELMSVSYIGGIQLEYPLTLRKMGSGISISNFIELSGDDENSRKYFLDNATSPDSVLFGTTYGSVKYDKEYSQITADDSIRALSLYGEHFSVNGIKTDSSPDDVVKALGEPDSISENDEYSDIRVIKYNYCEKNSGEEFIEVVFKSDKVLRIDVEL